MFTHSSPDELAAKQIDAIKERAISLWGDKWLATLVREYSAIMGSGEKGRYTQLKRIFETKNCTISTLSALLMSVDCGIQLVCYEKPKVINL